MTPTRITTPPSLSPTINSLFPPTSPLAPCLIPDRKTTVHVSTDSAAATAAVLLRRRRELQPTRAQQLLLPAEEAADNKTRSNRDKRTECNKTQLLDDLLFCSATIVSLLISVGLSVGHRCWYSTILPDEGLKAGSIRFDVAKEKIVDKTRQCT